ncbi:MAG: DUF4411 family protein [Acidobacteriota bacterium]
MIYSFDTSTFMDWQARHYPLDVFPSLEHALGRLIADARGAAVDVVLEEIIAVGTPELVAWAKGKKGLFVPLETDIQEEAARIQAKYPDLMDPGKVYEDADAYVIALAKLREGGMVVSQETSAAEKRNPKKAYYIPDVCRDLGVSCINLLGLMRREKWAF